MLAMALWSTACSSPSDAEPAAPSSVETADPAGAAADPDELADPAGADVATGSAADDGDTDDSGDPDAVAAATTTIPPWQAEIEALAEALTPRQKALQLLVVSAWGPDPLTAVAEALGSKCVGGVFVAKGFEHWSPPESAAAAAEAISEISEASASCAVPLFIASDAEPGTAILKVPVAPLPAPAALTRDYLADPGVPQALADQAAGFAAELRSLGIHVNFGVVADVDAGPDYFMAAKGRTFGGDPAAVAALTSAIVEGHCRSGVAAALKHFPNQGSTLEDPHLADSYSTNDPARWARHGRIPYASVDAPLVMTGHVRYREVDDATPASLSAEITTGWLRDDLGYAGVIISDDLYSMRGAGSEMAIPARGVAAILAGSDMALYLEVDGVGEAVDELTRLLDGDFPVSQRLETSLRRVLELKAALGLIEGIDPARFELCAP